jgi:hypothetical protein
MKDDLYISRITEDTANRSKVMVNMFGYYSETVPLVKRSPYIHFTDKFLISLFIANGLEKYPTRSLNTSIRKSLCSAFNIETGGIWQAEINNGILKDAKKRLPGAGVLIHRYGRFDYFRTNFKSWDMVQVKFVRNVLNNTHGCKEVVSIELR